MMSELVTIQDATKWASSFLNKTISVSNISYLVQYGKVKKHNNDGTTFVNINDLKEYYTSFKGKREIEWKERLGKDLNWELSFDNLREKDTTKHVHRLHPYKGKFIPQLVEYFIDTHVDKFKTQSYFKPGDTILDPFSGSGTTLVQAKEMGINSIGIDISEFNCLITEAKTSSYKLDSLEKDILKIRNAIKNYETEKNIVLFERELQDRLTKFNNRYFPSPQYKYELQKGDVDERKYAAGKENEFYKEYQQLIENYKIELNNFSDKSFLRKWYMKNVYDEIQFAASEIEKIENIVNKKALKIILSRTIRSCRATTHSDLATLKEPQVNTYYCWKHKKICKPIFTIKSWFDRYTVDTLERINAYNLLAKDSKAAVLVADSRTVSIFNEIEKKDKQFGELLKKDKIKGIFCSPPYVGQIDYHEQHAYAYDLFNLERRDSSEIGPLYNGQGLAARNSYIDGISKVLNNCEKYLVSDYDVFLVANDKYNLYPEIAKQAGMKIVNKFKRPVLNRTERDKNPYSEIIFHFKRL